MLKETKTSCTLIGFLLVISLVGTDEQTIANSGNLCPGFCFCDADWSLVSCTGDVDTVMPDSSVFASSVQRLEYRNFIVPRLEHLHVGRLNGLRELSLVGCRLTHITNGTFRDSERLERLDLSQNLIAILTQGMLTGLVRLKSLDLSSNKLAQIGGALEQLGALEHLNLRDNGLLTITADSFKGLYRLEFLNLDDNNVSIIEEDTFQELPNLAHLILSHNPLTKLQHLDLFAARPTYVDLSYTQLRRIPTLIARYIRDLRMSGNDLGAIQRGDLESYGQVKLLILDENGITDIEADTMGRMEQLEQLYLNSNQLTAIPINLPSSSLTALFLQNNRISCVKVSDLQGLGRLQQLGLGRNIIDSIDMAAFDQLTSLIHLDLSHNRLSAIGPEMFYGLNRLQVLDISGNPITQIEPMTFIHLPAVKLVTSSSPTLANSKATLVPSMWADWTTPLSTTKRQDVWNTMAYVEPTSSGKPIPGFITTTQSTAVQTSQIESLPEGYQGKTTSLAQMAAGKQDNGGRASDTSQIRRDDRKSAERSVTTESLLTAQPTRIDIRSFPQAVGVEWMRTLGQSGEERKEVQWRPIGQWTAVSSLILIGILAVSLAVYCLVKSRWGRMHLPKLRPLRSKGGSVWKTRGVKASRAEKDSIKMGWSVEDFDRWTTSLSISPNQPQLPCNEDERLLLAVVPPRRMT